MIADRSRSVGWAVWITQKALALQEELVARKLADPAEPDHLLLLEHEPVYTIGRTPDRSSLPRSRAPATSAGHDHSHSVTRHSMEEHLDGETYGGRFIVADVKLTLPVSPGRARIFVGPSGFVLLALLPESRFLVFVNRDNADKNDTLPSAADLAALLSTRLGADIGLSDLRWTSYFQMHKRVVPALSDGRRFLLGDAGHLSSPMGGEGINSAFMDGGESRVEARPRLARGGEGLAARQLCFRAGAR